MFKQILIQLKTANKLHKDAIIFFVLALVFMLLHLDFLLLCFAILGAGFSIAGNLLHEIDKRLKHTYNPNSEYHNNVK